MDMKIVSQRVRDPETGRTVQHAVGECVRCRRHVTLAGFTNTCDCGADYNGSGDLLASREQWGEETGETVADILMADIDPWNERDNGPPTRRDTPQAMKAVRPR